MGKHSIVNWFINKSGLPTTGNGQPRPNGSGIHRIQPVQKNEKGNRLGRKSQPSGNRNYDPSKGDQGGN